MDNPLTQPLRAIVFYGKEHYGHEFRFLTLPRIGEEILMPEVPDGNGGISNICLIVRRVRYIIGSDEPHSLRSSVSQHYATQLWCDVFQPSKG